MAIDSAEVLYVQQSLRAIGMNVGTKDGVADEDFKKGVLEALTVLRQSLTKNPDVRITDFSGQTRQALAAEIEQFMKGSDFGKLDALTRALEDPTNRRAILAEPVLDLAGYQQRAVGIILKGGPKAIQLAIEQIGSDEAAASFKYINPTAPEGQRIEKPEAVRANTPGMIAVLKNYQRIFAALDTVYAPEVQLALAAAPAGAAVAADPVVPRPDPTLAASSSSRPTFARATTGSANPFAPVGAVNPLFALGAGLSSDQGQTVTASPGAAGATQAVTGQPVENPAASAGTATATPAVAATGAATTAEALTTEQAIANVKDVLGIISSKMNERAAAESEGMAGISFQVEEPGEDGPVFDAHSQRSLQSVLWALRGPRGLDMPVDGENPDDEMWRYSPAVGAEIKRKLPRLLSKMEEKERKAIEEVLRQSDFFNSLNLLHKEGLLGERTQVAQNPVQISGWLKSIVGWIVPVIMPILSRISPNAEQMVNSFLGEKMGLSLADLMPEKFQLRRGPGETSPAPGAGDEPDETFVAGSGRAAEPAATTASLPEEDVPGDGIGDDDPPSVETSYISPASGALRGHFRPAHGAPQHDPPVPAMVAVADGPSVAVSPALQAILDARPEIEEWAAARKGPELKVADPNGPAVVA